MHRKGFKMNPLAVQTVEKPASQIVEDLTEEKDRCTMRFVLPAVNLQRFLSSQVATSQFIAGPVIVLKNKLLSLT